MKEIAFIKCPKCKLNKIEARNIGFINCEWSYRGYLANKKNCAISGDGFTIDEKLYILNEVVLNQYIEKLEIVCKEKAKIQTINQKYKKQEDNDSNGDIDYDSIGLESIHSNQYKDSSIHFQKNNKENPSFNYNLNCNNKSNVNTPDVLKKKQCHIENTNNITNSELKNKIENSINPNFSNANNSSTGLLQLKTNFNMNLVKSKTEDLEIITEKKAVCHIGNCFAFFNTRNKSKDVKDNNLSENEACIIF